jgi:putative transposase
MDEEHLLATVRYIELNPVRAGLCSDPREWRWSSVHAHFQGVDDGLVDVEPMLERVSDWDVYLSESPTVGLIEAVRKNVMSGRPAGNEAFTLMAEELSGKRLRRRKPGPASKRFRN